MQMGAPMKNPLMVNLEEGTYTASRELTAKEIEKVIANMYREMT